MRRVVLAAVLASLALTVVACGDEGHTEAVPSTTQGPMPTTHVFDQPFAVSPDGGEATITLSGLRVTTSSAYKDDLLVVDLRAVQSAGAPSINPADVHAFDPGGDELERLEYPKGTVPDPLVQSTLQAPAQEVRGMVAWKLPQGMRVGRIDYRTPRSVASLTVVRQPTDPDATTTASSGSDG